MEITEVSYEELKSHIGHGIDLFWSGDRSNPDTMNIMCITCDKTLVSRRIPVNREIQAEEVAKWLGDTCKTYPHVEVHHARQAWLKWERDQMDDDITLNQKRVEKMMPAGVEVWGGGLNDAHALVMIAFSPALWYRIVSDPR